MCLRILSVPRPQLVEVAHLRRRVTRRAQPSTSRALVRKRSPRISGVGPLVKEPRSSARSSSSSRRLTSCSHNGVTPSLAALARPKASRGSPPCVARSAAGAPTGPASTPVAATPALEAPGASKTSGLVPSPGAASSRRPSGEAARPSLAAATRKPASARSDAPSQPGVRARLRARAGRPLRARPRDRARRAPWRRTGC